ncbi:hypothetical protein POTOM_041446 [Populus tomentosa]|uniref:Berberine/berberine-like domain-containing protein n=1 Tax=Populus tomentosa TaxID=118781 RepID=A0A8X7YW20_POPTO|nr:hypothetical protein POTOM_041446 [Populus tomentosa]
MTPFRWDLVVNGDKLGSIPAANQAEMALILGIICLDLGMNKKTNTSFIEASVWGANFFKGNFKRLVEVKTQLILRTSSGMNRAFHHFHLP